MYGKQNGGTGLTFLAFLFYSYETFHCETKTEFCALTTIAFMVLSHSSDSSIAIPLNNTCMNNLMTTGEKVKSF